MLFGTEVASHTHICIMYIQYIHVIRDTGHVGPSDHLSNHVHMIPSKRFR